MTSSRACRTDRRRPPHACLDQPTAARSARRRWRCSLATRLWVCRKTARLVPEQTAVTSAR